MVSDDDSAASSFLPWDPIGKDKDDTAALQAKIAWFRHLDELEKPPEPFVDEGRMRTEAFWERSHSPNAKESLRGSREGNNGSNDAGTSSAAKSLLFFEKELDILQERIHSSEHLLSKPSTALLQIEGVIKVRVYGPAFTTKLIIASVKLRT
jgi:hypothetical protein